MTTPANTRATAATKDPKSSEVLGVIATLRKRLAATERELAEAEAGLGLDYNALAEGRSAAEGQDRAILVLQIDKRALLAGIAAAERELAAAQERERMVGVMAEREKLVLMLGVQQAAAAQLTDALDVLATAIGVIHGSGDAVLEQLAGAEANTLTPAGWQVGHPVAQLREREWLRTLINANLSRRLGVGWPYERGNIAGVDIGREIEVVGLSALQQFDRKHRSSGAPRALPTIQTDRPTCTPEEAKARIAAAKAEVDAENARVRKERLASLTDQEAS